MFILLNSLVCLIPQIYVNIFKMQKRKREKTKVDKKLIRKSADQRICYALIDSSKNVPTEGSDL